MGSVRMGYKHFQKLFNDSKHIATNRSGAMHLNAMLYHCREETYQELLPSEWYARAFQKMRKLTLLLKNVDLVDGRLVDITDGSTIVDDRVRHKMHTFKTLTRVFIGSPSSQERLKENMVALSTSAKLLPDVSFAKPSEREGMVIDSLTKVSNILNVTAQQRKRVRLTICRQVTQHRIWIGALEEILNELKSDLECSHSQSPSKGTEMGLQIVSSCLELLKKATCSDIDMDSSSWMRLSPIKVVHASVSHKWEDVLEICNDLIDCMKNEKGLVLHVTKLEVMKEGLSQIKDISIDRSIGYKEARYQESLVQKKLSRALGHSSKCLFTLLLYYLYGYVRDLEVDVCGGFQRRGGEDSFTLCMGKFLSSNEEKMVWSGVKQLDRALGLFKFVWETAGFKAELELQGHIWCVGGKGQSLAYRGNTFFVHGISA